MGLTRFTDLHPKEYKQKFANLQVTIPDTIRLTSAEKLKVLRTELENSSTRLKELTLRKKRLEKLI